MPEPDETRRGTVYGRAKPPETSVAPADALADPPKARKRGLARIIGFFDTTTKVVAAVTGMVTAIIGLYALIHQYVGPHEPVTPPSPTPSIAADVIAADQIGKCVEHHKMTAKTTISRDGGGIPTKVQF